jgi:hypothetical protein
VLLAVDIGTSHFKSALWDFEGNQIACAAVPLSISLSDGLRHEADSGNTSAAITARHLITKRFRIITIILVALSAGRLWRRVLQAYLPPAGSPQADLFFTIHIEKGKCFCLGRKAIAGL